jgi:exodeoxyribonuclease V
MTVTLSYSTDQQHALDRILEWFRAAPVSRWCDEDCPDTGGLPHTHGTAQGYPVLSLGGLAGSGKTWLAGRLAEELSAKVAYGAPTHRAAAVLRGKLPPIEADRVRTYHSLLYRPSVDYTCGATGGPVDKIPCGCADPEDCRCEKRFTPCGKGVAHDCPVQEHLRFTLRQAVGGHRDLIILDEASMLSQQKVEEIASLGLPVLLVGDHGQLPPVKEQMNTWMRAPELLLEENHRQEEASGIVAAALGVRSAGRLALGRYGDGSTFVASAKLRPDVLDIASPERVPPGPERAIICHTNAMRAAVNQRYRQGFAGPLVPGDRLVALQNGDRVIVSQEDGGIGDGPALGGWRPNGGVTFVFNSACGTVEHVVPAKRADQPWLDAVVRLDVDQQGRTDTRVLTRIAIAQLGNPRRLRRDEHADTWSLWDYAYAITCHKAQGSEYDDVVVLDTGSPDWVRWIYTAMTRARNRLVVVNWNTR